MNRRWIMMVFLIFCTCLIFVSWGCGDDDDDDTGDSPSEDDDDATGDDDVTDDDDTADTTPNPVADLRLGKSVRAEARRVGTKGTSRGSPHNENTNEATGVTVKDQLPSAVTEGYCTSRTCEIGLGVHSGIPYRSILYLVDRCTHKKP